VHDGRRCTVDGACTVQGWTSPIREPEDGSRALVQTQRVTRTACHVLADLRHASCAGHHCACLLPPAANAAPADTVAGPARPCRRALHPRRPPPAVLGSVYPPQSAWHTVGVAVTCGWLLARLACLPGHRVPGTRVRRNGQGQGQVASRAPSPMGITGLCPLIKELCTLLKIKYRKNLYAVAKDKVVGIDGHGLLHRAACVPVNAHAILFDDDYGPMAELFTLWVCKMKEGGVDPRVVFDGAVTPGKAEEKNSTAVYRCRSSYLSSLSFE
jgi:hypothetical protein